MPTATVVTIIHSEASPPWRLVRTFDAMHDETSTERARAGCIIERGKLAAVLARRAS